MTILILQTGEPLDIDEGGMRPMRAINLTNNLNKENIKVELISSVFDHTNKRHRKNLNIKYDSKLRKTYLLKSPGYKSNISFARIFDHSLMSLSLIKYLIKKRNKPNLVFIGFPPIETAFIMSIYCKWNNIPYILDIKDLWPFIFIEHFPKKFRKIFTYLLIPYKFMANFCSSHAAIITGPSNGYLNSIKKLYKIGPKNKTLLFPLSSENKNSDISRDDIVFINKFIKNKDLPVISFAGSMMRSAYDFKTVKEAFNILETEGIKFNFLLAGDGETKEELLSLFSNLKSTSFTGWLNKSKLEVLYNISTAIIAPYRNNLNYQGHIPNKVYDCFRAYKPLITTLEGDTTNLIYEYNIGFVYSTGDFIGLSKIIKKILQDNSLIKNMENNIRDNLNHILPIDEAFEEIKSLYYSSL